MRCWRQRIPACIRYGPPQQSLVNGACLLNIYDPIILLENVSHINMSKNPRKFPMLRKQWRSKDTHGWTGMFSHLTWARTEMLPTQDFSFWGYSDLINSVQSLVWIPSSNPPHWNQHVDFSLFDFSVRVHWEKPVLNAKGNRVSIETCIKELLCVAYSQVFANLLNVCICGSAEWYFVFAIAAERRSQLGSLCTLFTFTMQTATL